MLEYQEKAIQQLNDIVLNQENAIMQAAEYLAACIINDHIIHTFGRFLSVLGENAPGSRLILYYK